MKERVSKLTYPTLGQKRGYKLLLKRIKSAFPVKIHIYTLFPS